MKIKTRSFERLLTLSSTVSVDCCCCFFSLLVVVSDNRDVSIEDVETQSISDQTEKKREREREIVYRFF